MAALIDKMLSCKADEIDGTAQKRVLGEARPQGHRLSKVNRRKEKRTGRKMDRQKDDRHADRQKDRRTQNSETDKGREIY